MFFQCMSYKYDLYYYLNDTLEKKPIQIFILYSELFSSFLLFHNKFDNLYDIIFNLCYIYI